MKKFLAMILIVLLVISFCSSAFAASNFEVLSEKGKELLDAFQNIVTKLLDIKNHWANSSIEELINLGAISGYLDNTFRPDNTITRAEFVKIHLASLGNNPGNAVSGHWADNYIKEAKTKGYIKDGEFDNIDKNITRGEIARIIIRSLNESYPDNMDKYGQQITDYNSISSQYKEYALKAYVKGIVTGYPDSTFGTDKTATRAEASTMIVRMLDASKRKVPELQKDINDISFPETDKKKIIEKLKQIPPDHESGSMEIAHEKFMKAYGYDVDLLVSLAEGYSDTWNNFDYRNLPEDFKSELLKYLEATSWVGYNSDGSKKFSEQYVEEYIEGAKEYKIILKSRFITDKSLVYLGGDEGAWRVRGTFQFYYASPSDTKFQWKKTTIETDKWYELDMEIEFGKFNWSNDYTLSREINLGIPRLINE